ncbi:WD40/YVTN/BNR-like repeat-containing protein [Lutimonas sp.]|uniref:WD40/YVTN/BNR-like repeat-containing protein n=1 Tax=Lutimonas sp. TaxID=1872403 RepID=UPI003D9B397B
MKKIVLLLVLTSIFTQAQQIDIEKLSGLKPRAIGPAGMSGRITAIDVITNQPNVIYVGAASGGVWKSESQGISWKPIFDKEQLQGIGAIKIQQSNPDVIWVGTGEGNPRNSLNGGYGIYKSLDGGKNWTLMGLEKTRNIHRIVIDRDNPDIVYVAAIGSPWGEHKERGVFKTTDGGKTWKNILFVNNKTGAADLVVDANNPNKLIAAMWEHRRKPYTFNSGGEGSGIYISFDGGDNWTKRTKDDGLPEGNLGRIGLAISQSNPKVVYALVEAKKNGLYRSDDGGFKWTLINSKSSGRGSSGIGNRPFYYSDIFVDPTNEHRLYTVFTYVNYSIDGGKSFKQLMPAYNSDAGIHPDHHAWWIHPNNPDYMIDGNDGGLNITQDKGKTWRFVENLPVGQFYHISVDNEFPYNLYGGMQDNGSWVGPAYTFKAQGIRNSYWQEILFGDGFDVIPDPKNNRFGYGMSQQGYVSRYDRETGASKLIRPVHPDPDIKLRFNWNSAIAIDPFDQSTIYFGSQFVHRSKNQGHEWDIISPDLTTNDPKKQQQYDSGGLTMDATGAENYCTILVIAPSQLEKDVLWVGTDDGRIQLSKNAGESWSDVSPTSGSYPKDGWVAQIKVSAFNKGEAYAVVNNYRNFDFKPYLFRTKNYGQSWESLLGEKDETFGYSLSLVQDPKEKSLLFLGTENGLYLSIDEGNSWTKWNKNYPSVPTMDMVIHPKEQDLAIATFGRSFYVLDDLRPLREIAKTGASTIDNGLQIFEPPTAYLAQYQQPSGTRFGGNAIFNGENRKSGAMITYVFNEDKKADDTVKLDSINTKNDSLSLQVFNQQNVLIRTLQFKKPKDGGLHRMYWNLDEKGVFSPSRKKVSTEKEPAGVKVIPGDYKLVLRYKHLKDSTKITVKYDPRIDLSSEVLQKQYDMLKELEIQKDLVYRAVERLKESKTTVATVKKQANSIDKETYKDLIQSSDSINKSIDSLIDGIMGKEDKRQGITSQKEPSAVSYLNNAIYYVRSLQQLPGATEIQLIENANLKLKPAILSVNEFYNLDWPAYRKEVEAAKLSIFKEYKILE